LLFVNHLPSWQLSFEHERELQAVPVARFVEELVARRDRHVVLVGDFDADPGAASVRFWSGRQSLGGLSVCYRDAWESAHPGEPGHTFTPDRPPPRADPDWPFRRIDYIFVRCGLHGGPTLAMERRIDEPQHGQRDLDRAAAAQRRRPAATPLTRPGTSPAAARPHPETLKHPYGV